MSKGKSATNWFVVGTILLITFYDLLALFFFQNATISEVFVLGAVEFSQPVVFGVGFTFGHIFWPQKKERSEPLLDK